MIRLTKLNNEPILINSDQIMLIELIPESKIVLSNKEFYIVRESSEEIVEKIIEFNARVYNLHQELSIEKNF